MSESSILKNQVLKLYLSHPYPQWSKEERHRRFGSEIPRYHFLGLADALTDSRFLDVGCGTGNRSMLAAKHFGVKEFVGLDHSSVSLDIAKQVAEEEGFERFTPVEGNLFEIPYPDGYFDVVVSWGVLHHTHDPLGGLREMVRVCHPGGYIGVFLYNRWNHWRHNMQKRRVSRIAGEHVEKRFRVAHELYGTKPVDEMRPDEIAEFYDQYCHPYKSDHTIGETLRWFCEMDLDFVGSYPPLRVRDFVSLVKMRTDLAEEYPFGSNLTRRLASLSRFLPHVASGKPPFKRPTVFHRFFWQAVYAWMGRHGEYSQGAALSARKR